MVLLSSCAVTVEPSLECSPPGRVFPPRTLIAPAQPGCPGCPGLIQSVAVPLGLPVMDR
jgi:hypothetical protein